MSLAVGTLHDYKTEGLLSIRKTDARKGGLRFTEEYVLQ